MPRLVRAGLSVSIDGDIPVCIACAERCANEGGLAHLFWMFNRPERCSGAEVCPGCSGRMDSKRAQEAAGRVADTAEAASELCHRCHGGGLEMDGLEGEAQRACHVCGGSGETPPREG